MLDAKKLLSILSGSCLDFIMMNIDREMTEYDEKQKCDLATTIIINIIGNFVIRITDPVNAKTLTVNEEIVHLNIASWFDNARNDINSIQSLIEEKH